MTRSTPTLLHSNAGSDPDVPAAEGHDAVPLRPTPSSESVASLTDLLGRQCSLYEQLCSLCEQQHRQITSGSVEELLDVLSQRQDVINQLAQIERDIEPYRRRWQEFWGQQDDGDRQRINETLQRSQRALALIIEQDDRSRQMLEDARERLGGELTQISHAGAAMQAYKVSSPPDNRFTNQQG